MPLPPYFVYNQQLSSLCLGYALWEPDPCGLYDHISIGDVGYIRGGDGHFIRMFNVLPSLNDDPFQNIRTSVFGKETHLTRYVTTPGPSPNTDDTTVTYACRKRFGALLDLPCGGQRTDVIRKKAFEMYFRDHIDRWFAFARENGLDVERMEDIILVSGCTLVTSWAAAVFHDDSLRVRIPLKSKALGNGAAEFQWGPDIFNPGGVYRHNSYLPSNGHPLQNQCVFIRGFRGKRNLFYMTLRGAAEPLPDDPNNRPEDEVQVMREPDVSSQRDPLIGVLSYIAQKCPENAIAIAHHNDLQYIEGVETFTADSIEGFLHSKNMGVLVESGGAVLQDDEDISVPDDAKAVFHAHAGLSGQPESFVLHPVLSRYNLKLDIDNEPDHDYDLPEEEIDSPATYPPMHSLILENRQGYPYPITVRASGDSPGMGVTVRDVLRTIHEDGRKQLRRNELYKLEAAGREGLNDAFVKRCKTERELSQGPRRVDYLCGRDRLVVVRKPPSEGVPVTDEVNIAGPSTGIVNRVEAGGHLSECE